LVAQDVPTHLMEEAAVMTLREIRARTRSGVDYRGRSFAPYAPSTARRKGRTQPVTLTETGRFLNALQVLEVRPGFARIGWPDTFGMRLKRWHHGGTSRMPDRRFFAFGDRLSRRIRQMLRPWVLRYVGWAR